MLDSIYNSLYTIGTLPFWLLIHVGVFGSNVLEAIESSPSSLKIIRKHIERRSKAAARGLQTRPPMTRRIPRYDGRNGHVSVMTVGQNGGRSTLTLMGQFPAPGTRAATYVTSDSPNSDDPHNLPQRGVRPSTWDQRPASTQAAAKRPTATPSPAQRTQDSKRSRHKYRGRDEYYHLYTSHGVDPLDEPTKCSQAPQPEDLFVHDCMPNGVQVWIWQDDRWVTIRTWTKHPRIPRLYLELKHGDNPKWLCASTIETHARKLARKRD
ncbi:hypothetical protein FA95DRAFT_1605932 [Auriscalpium vulgare]|uniref:Uncharacterized protein n=1 Tax=Auriscalpium vulgare TaxID=40419 RepID=A0ACB8RU72_9AGAM|nr:hypothetical protein FA95DRAFT_1605932 [Auriscalpium vulgare]